MAYVKKKSQKQEKRTAKEFSGRTQPASGALSGAKGDVITGSRGIGFNESDYLIENKFTDKTSYKLELATWRKIEKEALNDNFRTPMMQIDIQDLQVVVIDTYLFLQISGLRPLTVTSKAYIPFKSYKLNKTDLEELFAKQFNKNSLPHKELSFEEGGKKINSLVVIPKSTFLKIMEER